jgi:hypothetical protein
MQWMEFYNTIINDCEQLAGETEYRCYNPFFRGLSDNTHKIIPTLFRNSASLPPDVSPREREMTIFNFFKSQSGIFHLGTPRSSWEILFEMRHHGIPTRLMDWTGSFAVALYFALKENSKETTPCIWRLNPLKLNVISQSKRRVISILDDSSFDYEEKFLHSKTLPFNNPIAILPIRNHPRLIAQNSFFTVHGTNIQPLDEIYGEDVIKRFDIPKEIIPEAKIFLKLTNINEYTLFPDLDGLGRYINEIYFL